MVVFVLLLVLFGIANLPPLARRLNLMDRRAKGAFALGLMLIFAGVLHFLQPAPFVAMVPPQLAFPQAIVAVSGAAEVAIGAGLLVRRLRNVAALAAVLLFVAVLPANIYAAASGVEVPGYTSSSLYRWLRVPLQAVLIAWALAVREPDRIRE